MNDSFYKGHMVPVFLLLVIVAAVFGNCLLNGFVWDDTIDLIGNSVYRDFNIRKIFTTLPNGREYLPIRDLSYALDYGIWGESAAGFHFTNLVLYGAGVVAVYFLCVNLLCFLRTPLADNHNRRISFWVALIFAVHPLHSEPTAWVTGRNVLLSGNFLFLSLIFFLLFLRRQDSKRHIVYAASLFFFLLAILSKATVIILPLLLLPALFVKSRGSFLLRSATLIPFFSLSAVFFIIFRKIGIATEQIDLFSAAPAGDLPTKLAVSVQIPLFYLGKIFLPLSLSAEYDTRFSSTWGSAETLAGLIVVVILVTMAVAWWKKFPEGAAGTYWYLVTLIPVLHLMPTNPVVADRYAYLPLFGIVLAGVSGVFRAESRVKTVFPVVVLALCVIFLSGLSYQRNRVWKTETSLWEATIQTSPRQVKAYVNLADAHFKAGHFAAGLHVLQQAAQLNPRFDYYHFYLGNYHIKRNNFPAAADAFLTALAHNAEYIDALYALGNVYEWLGQPAKAREFYQKTINARAQDDSGFRKAASESLQRLQ